MSFHESIFLLVVLLANIVEAMTGFAGTLLAMPASMILIGVDEAKTVLNAISLICCTWITIRYHKNMDKKEFKKITFFMFIGLLVGVGLFDILSVDYLLKIYALVIIAVALKNIFLKRTISINKIVMICIIVLAGIIHGMFLSGGSLLVIYAATVLKDKSVFRATIAPVWVVLDSFMFVNQVRLGFVNNYTITLILLSLIPLGLAIFIGNKLHDKINQKTFLLMTYFLLLVSGVSLMMK